MATSSAAISVPIVYLGFGELRYVYDLLAIVILGWLLLFVILKILNVLAALGEALAYWVTTKVIRWVMRCIFERTCANGPSGERVVGMRSGNHDIGPGPGDINQTYKWLLATYDPTRRTAMWI
jgi:hypothetical protein